MYTTIVVVTLAVGASELHFTLIFQFKFTFLHYDRF